MFSVIVEILLMFGIPLLILRWRSSGLISVIGTVGAAYLAGLLYSLAATVVFPGRDTSVSEILVYVSISLAIPLLLFSGNIKNVRRLSRVTLTSFLLLAVSVVSVTVLLFFFYTKNVEEGAVLSGMAAALYVGGTPNLNAVACLFKLNTDLIFTANLADLLFGGIFYIFLLFAAKPLLSKFLKNGREAPLAAEVPAQTCDAETVGFSFRHAGVLRNLMLSVLILLLSFGIGLAVWVISGMADGTMTDYVIPALMLGTTVGGIGFSFVGKVNAVCENEQMGRYFAAVFSYAIASILDIRRFGALSWRVFVVYAVITTGAVVLHALLCRIFHIGADTMLITATAGIYGPAFIPSVSKAIGAEYLMTSGLIVGSFGYAVGTFIGIGCTYFLKLFT